MPAPSGNKFAADGPTARLSELGIILPAPPTPLGTYVESSDAGNLLFLSGTSTSTLNTNQIYDNIQCLRCHDRPRLAGTF